MIVNKAMLHLPDWTAIDLPPHERQASRTMTGINSSLMLPLLRDGECIGVLVLARDTAGAFSDKEIALAKSFVDQAVIAIENVRLFNETKEALERQTATADVLQVISESPRRRAAGVRHDRSSAAAQLIGATDCRRLRWPTASMLHAGGAYDGSFGDDGATHLPAAAGHSTVERHGDLRTGAVLERDSVARRATRPARLHARRSAAAGRRLRGSALACRWCANGR